MGNDFPIIPFLVQHTTGITEVRSLDQESGEAKMIPVKGTAKLCNVVSTKAQGTGDVVRKLPYISNTLQKGVGNIRQLYKAGRGKLRGTARAENETKPAIRCRSGDLHLYVGLLQRQVPTLKSLFAKVTEIEMVKQGRPVCLEDTTYIVEGEWECQRIYMCLTVSTSH